MMMDDKTALDDRVTSVGLHLVMFCSGTPAAANAAATTVANRTNAKTVQLLSRALS